MSKQDFSTRPASPANRRPDSSNGEIDLKKYITVVWRGKFVVGAFLVIFLIIGLFYSRNLAVATYSATTVLVYGNDNGKVINGIPVNEHPTIVQMGLNTQLEVIKSRDMVSELVQDLSLADDPNFVKAVTGINGSPENQKVSERKATSWILARVSTSNKRLSRIIRITVKTKSGQLSALLANGLANLYVERQRSIGLREFQINQSIYQEQANILLKKIQEIETEIAALKKLKKSGGITGSGDPLVEPTLLALANRLETANGLYQQNLTQQADNTARVSEGERQTRILSLASGGKAKLSQNRLMVFLFLFAGLFLGLLVALVREATRSKFASTAELEAETGIKVFGPITTKPESMSVVGSERPGESMSLPISRAKAALLFDQAEGRTGSAVISSAGPIRCVVELTLAIGRDLARSGQSVLVVDAISNAGSTPDLKPEQPAKPKLADHIQLDAAADMSVVKLSDLATPCRSMDSFVLAKKVLEQSENNYDFVLFAVHPISKSVDTNLIGQTVDQILLIVKAASTTKSALRQSIKDLNALNLQVDGLLFCGLK